MASDWDMFRQDDSFTVIFTGLWGKCVEGCQGSVLEGQLPLGLRPWLILRNDNGTAGGSDSTGNSSFDCCYHISLLVSLSLPLCSSFIFFSQGSLSSLNFCISPFTLYLIILLGASNYGLTDGQLKHNWIFLLCIFPKEKLPQWHLSIWKSHGWVANQWGLPHEGGRCPRAAPWLILWSVSLAKWKQARHLTVNCDAFFLHFISISLFHATKELMPGEFIMTHCLACGINRFFPFLCSDSPPLSAILFYGSFCTHPTHAEVIEKHKLHRI